MRILVAEDETIIRLDLRALLERAGFEVCAEARDGEEAVELARTALDLATLAHTHGLQERTAMHLHDAYALFWELRVPIYVERARHLAAAFGVSLTEKEV